MPLYYLIHDRSENKHTHATPAVGTFEFKWLNECQAIHDWDSQEMVHIVNEQYPAKDYEDIPWLSGGTGELLASQKFCNLVKSLNHEMAQLLQVKSVYNEPCNLSPFHYCVINWLHQIDATDYSKSEFRINEHHGYEYVHRHVVDWSLVPKEALVFRLKHRPTMLYSSKRFLDIVDDHGITGLCRERAN